MEISVNHGELSNILLNFGVIFTRFFKNCIKNQRFVQSTQILGRFFSNVRGFDILVIILYLVYNYKCIIINSGLAKKIPINYGGALY